MVVRKISARNAAKKIKKREKNKKERKDTSPPLTRIQHKNVIILKALKKLQNMR